MTLTIGVVGATGATGRLVLAELVAEGHRPVAIGRRAERLGDALRAVGLPEGEARAAPVVGIETLAGLDAVIGCAGPFGSIGLPLVHAAVRAGVPYTDVAPDGAFVQAVADVHAQALRAGVSVVPGAGVTPLVGDLAATLSGAADAEVVRIGYRLGGYRPTPGSVRSALAVLEAGTVKTVRCGELTDLSIGRRLGHLPSGGLISFSLPDAAVVSRWSAARSISVGIIVPRVLAPVTAVALRAATTMAKRHSAAERQATGERPKDASVLVEAACSTIVRLSGDDLYAMTARGAVMVAAAIAGGRAPSGVLAPHQVLGDPLAAAARLGLRVSGP